MQSIPALWNNFVAFKDKVEELHKMIQLQLRNITGITIDKKECRAKLINSLLRVSAMVKSYAANTNDLDLYATVNYTYSALRNMGGEVMYEAAMIVYKLAEVNAAELIPYGCQLNTLADLADEIAKYKALVAAPDEAIKMRKTYTSYITKIDKQIRKMLKTGVDNGMVVLGSLKPDIYEKYKAVRRIYNRRGRGKDDEAIAA